jgi:hypothetical protein
MFYRLRIVRVALPWQSADEGSSLWHLKVGVTRCLRSVKGNGLKATNAILDRLCSQPGFAR